MTPEEMLRRAVAGDLAAATELGRLIEQGLRQAGTGLGERPLDRLADAQIVVRLHAQFLGGFGAHKLREIAWWGGG